MIRGCAVKGRIGPKAAKRPAAQAAGYDLQSLPRQAENDFALFSSRRKAAWLAVDSDLGRWEQFAFHA
jgi:hypothetical protein